MEHGGHMASKIRNIKKGLTWMMVEGETLYIKLYDSGVLGDT